MIAAPVLGLLYLDLLLPFVGALVGLLAGFVFGRFVPGRKLSSLLDLVVGVVASVVAILVCSWFSGRIRMSFDQLVTSELWACVVGSLALVVLCRWLAHSMRRAVR